LVNGRKPEPAMPRAGRMSYVQSLFGLAGIAILYGILQMKKDDSSGWENLD
jgi:hypothetical protein